MGILCHKEYHFRSLKRYIWLEINDVRSAFKNVSIFKTKFHAVKRGLTSENEANSDT